MVELPGEQNEKELKENFGLTGYEARAYVVLVKRGRMTLKDLSIEARIPLPRAYDTLRTLEEKGFVVSTPGRGGYFRAVSPEMALKKRIKEFMEEYEKLIELKRNSMEVLIKNLEVFFEASKHETQLDHVFLIRRIDNVVARAWDMIRRAEEEVLLVGYAVTDIWDSDKWDLREIMPIVYNGLKRGVPFKLMVPRLSKTQKEMIKNLNKAFEGRFMVKISKQSMLDLLIIDQREILLGVPDATTKDVFEGQASALWFMNPIFAKLLKRNVSLIWDQATETT